MKHIYRTTRDVEAVIQFMRCDGVMSPDHDTVVTIKAGLYVFRGGKRAFAARLAAFNAEYGAGYAVPETAVLA
jgi:hypothetical protein